MLGHVQQDAAPDKARQLLQTRLGQTGSIRKLIVGMAVLVHVIDNGMVQTVDLRADTQPSH
jgi:hypothetical protein